MNMIPGLYLILSKANFILLEITFYRHNLKEPRHIIEAIRQGHRGEYLAAFFRDYRCWMFVNPSM